MQAPFWKVGGEARRDLQEDFLQIVKACSVVGINQIVVPLVDAGSLNTIEEETVLREYLLSIQTKLLKMDVRVIFESDFAPAELAAMIAKFPEDSFGINYDIGNSAALGFSADEEFRSYSHRITNVHIKDRVLGGVTVPLGEGSADFATIFEELYRAKYTGNLILQTARSKTEDHSGALCSYRDFVLLWSK
jgi:hexulose-6-phosphate isomerase